VPLEEQLLELAHGSVDKGEYPVEDVDGDPERRDVEEPLEEVTREAFHMLILATFAPASRGAGRALLSAPEARDIRPRPVYRAPAAQGV
jgi:hypothetical protein